MSSNPNHHPFRAAIISCTRMKVRGGIRAAQRAMEEVNELILSEKTLEQAGFRWLGLVIREIDDRNDAPHDAVVRRVTRDGELPVVVDVSVRDLQKLSESEEELVKAYKRVMLTATISALDRVGLPTEALRRLLSDIG